MKVRNNKMDISEILTKQSIDDINSRRNKIKSFIKGELSLTSSDVLRGIT